MVLFIKVLPFCVYMSDAAYFQYPKPEQPSPWQFHKYTPPNEPSGEVPFFKYDEGPKLPPKEPVEDPFEALIAEALGQVIDERPMVYIIGNYPKPGYNTPFSLN